MRVIFFGCPMVRLMFSKRSVNWSTAARRKKNEVIGKLDLGKNRC
jgi:hypothetical protein